MTFNTNMDRPTTAEITCSHASPSSSHDRPPLRRRRLVWFGIVAAGLSLAGGVLVWVAGSVSEAVPAEASAPDVPVTDGRMIRFSENFAERIGLRTVEVRKATLAPTLSVVGTVTYDPEHVASVGTRLRGLVQRVLKHEGDEVHRGELLAEIDSAELGEAQASVAMYRAQKTAAEHNARREAELVTRNLTTAREAEIASAELDKFKAMLSAAEQKVSALGGLAHRDGTPNRLGVYPLRSPLDGTVIERHIAPGQSVEGHLVAFSIANLDHVWVELAVFDHQLPSVRLNDQVTIRPISTPEAAIAGRVANVGARIDPDTRSASVRVEIDNRDRALRIGQAVTAEIEGVPGSEQAMAVVPSTSVTFVDGQSVVFVAQGPQAVVVRPVTLAQSDGTDQQVAKGLKAGEQVVSEGVFPLKSELFR